MEKVQHQPGCCRWILLGAYVSIILGESFLLVICPVEMYIGTPDHEYQAGQTTSDVRKYDPNKQEEAGVGGASTHAKGTEARVLL